MTATAVLLSGGLDSAVLVASELGTATEVLPIHVRSGLAWEAAEARTIERLLARPPYQGRTRPLASVSIDMRDVYPPTHWAISGQPPAYDTPDEDVYLEGRNLTLLAKAGIVAARQRIGRLVIGPLAGNPFPDATPEFFAAMARALSLGLAREIEIAAPFARLHKEAVIALGMDLGVPLEHTLSCMNPRTDDRHCGVCSKCRERQEAFTAAGIPDPTSYAEAWVKA